MVNTASIAGADANSRLDFDTFDIPEPQDGQELTLIAVARLPGIITAINRKTAAGDCDLTVYINSVAVEFEDSDTQGTIVADTGAFEESLAVASNTFDERDKITILIENPSTGHAGLTIQIDTRLTQVNTS